MKFLVKVIDVKSAFLHIYYLIIGIILPQRCISCNKVIFSKDIGFCRSCWHDIPWIFGKVCKICGNELSSSASLADICLNCRIKKKHYNYSRSLVYYKSTGKELVLRCKYSENQLLYSFIARLLISRYGADLKTVDIIIPIPLHFFRLFSRGHNQAALLAEQISKQTKINLNLDVVRKVRYTPILAGYSKLQRQALLNSAFDIVANKQALIKNKNILLVDDVLSTASTINICSKLLKKHGAKQIYIITIARVDIQY